MRSVEKKPKGGISTAFTEQENLYTSTKTFFKFLFIPILFLQQDQSISRPRPQKSASQDIKREMNKQIYSGKSYHQSNEQRDSGSFFMAEKQNPRRAKRRNRMPSRK